MSSDEHAELTFASQTVSAKFIDPAGQMVEHPVEIRSNPLTGRTCRIALIRIKEKNAGSRYIRTNGALGTAVFGRLNDILVGPNFFI